MIGWLKSLFGSKPTSQRGAATGFEDSVIEWESWEQLHDCTADPDFPVLSLDDYSSEQLAVIRAGLREEMSGDDANLFPVIRGALLELWGSVESIAETLSEEFELVVGDTVATYDRAIQEADVFDLSFDLAEEAGVVFRMTAQFKSEVARVDKKLQGRILVAISELQDYPTTPRGDTVKPLAGELRGLWRYRIGDHRLIYRPSDDGTRVVLVSFAGRGSIYKE